MFTSLIKSAAIVLFCSTIFSNIAIAQESKEDKKAAQATAVKNMLEEKKYVFVATSVSPMSGRTRTLTSRYDLKIFKDTVISSLPYFGRAYTASIGTTDGGINFTSTDFEYTETPRKKGGWNIVIKFKDQTDFRQMDITIFETGSADLRVSSNTRQSISFSGDIEAGK